MTNAIRKHVSNFTVRLGPIAATGYLLPVRLSAAKDPEGTPATHFVSPDGQKVFQVYSDINGNTFTQKELKKGTIGEDGKVSVVDEDELDEATVSELPSNILDLTIHPAETKDQVYPEKSNGYVWVPHADEKKNVDLYNTILTAVRYSDKVFLGACNLKGHEGLYTLIEWRGHIVVQRVLYPASLNAHDTRDTRLPAQAKRAVLNIVDAMATEFEPDKYRNQVAARKAEVIASAIEVGGTAPHKAPKKVKVAVIEEHDLMATLDAMALLVNANV